MHVAQNFLSDTHQILWVTHRVDPFYHLARLHRFARSGFGVLILGQIPGLG